MPPQSILLKMYAKFIVLFVLLFSQKANTAILVKEHQWPQNSQLNVVFLDGTKELRDKVKQYAILWVKDTNLSFQFFDSMALAPKNKHIRISFTLNNASSLGNQGEYQASFATMNLVDLKSDRISEKGAKRLILHEFGHALGFEHEYLSPYWPYSSRVKKQAFNHCKSKISRLGYDKEGAIKRCKELNQAISKKAALTTAYDERSIMNYPFNFLDKDHTQRIIAPSFELSYLDQYAIQKWYPKN